MNRKIVANTLALFCVFVWGTTFIFTKVLLHSFNPVIILIYRLLISLCFLFMLSPKIFTLKRRIDELFYIGAGASGITFYFLFENFAIKYTSASSVGIIVSLAPMFTYISCAIVFRETKIHLNFIIGFLIAISGIVLLSLDSLKNTSQIDVRGIIYAIIAMICWGIYSCFVKKINSLGYVGIGSTRKIMYYGLLFLIPFYFILEGNFNFDAFKSYKIVIDILFLGIVASALCFVLWNYAVLNVGPVKCNIYLYLSPAITVVASAIVIHEKITVIIFFGLILSILGLLISSDIWVKKKLKEININGNIDIGKGEADERNTCEDEGNL